MRKLSHKRQIEILKSQEEYYNRVRISGWKDPEIDYRFRLEALIQFNPERSTRQIFNACNYVE
jgi:hypothetical protein